MALSRSALFLVITPIILFLLLYRMEFGVLVPDRTQLASGSRVLAGQLLSVLYKPKVSIKSGSAKPFVRHIVAVGDLHGDMLNARRVLQFSGVVDDYGNWTGHADFFVQTGDIIDRWVTFFDSGGTYNGIDAFLQAGTIRLLFLTGWINCVNKLCQRGELYLLISETTSG